ncbi:branched chain amino acid ABC transporter substrate-binding protein [Trinickia dabaoshanensis]|uniref:Branched chain amino acid ABC transporter substrate-binding protein n=2 Tax=Trinickia dabaoshanensis TaxID=564714 RepID=A0A2N7W3D9_9BURK|nr:branched chain amino acid ABC transporter substrate-binding protein [Trinickia dabaoshanensis]
MSDSFSRWRHRPRPMRAVKRLAAPLPMTTFAFALALGLASTRTEAQERIKIGVLVPLSGNYQSSGTDILNGAKLAVSHLNAAGGVLGKKLELVERDDACNPDRAANAASELIAAGVVAVAGGYCSSAALPESRILHTTRIPYVLDASTFPALTEHGWPDVFRTIGRTDTQGGYAATLMKDVLHATRAAVVNDGTAYSQGLASSTIAALEREGVKVVYDNALTPGQQDYRDVAKAAADTHPDVLYFTGYYTEAAVLAKNLRALGSGIKHFMGNGTADPSLIEKGGEAVEGMIVTTSPLPQFMTSASATRYIKAYEAEFGHPPGPYSIYEYDAIGVTARAIEQANSTEPEAISAALHRLGRYDGATGSIAFDAKGDRTRPAFMAVMVRGGKFEPYASLDAKGRWEARK